MPQRPPHPALVIPVCGGRGEFPRTPYRVSCSLRGEDIAGVNTYGVLSLVSGMKGGRALPRKWRSPLPPSWSPVHWFAGEERDPPGVNAGIVGVVFRWVWRCMEGQSPDLSARHPWAVKNIRLPE